MPRNPRRQAKGFCPKCMKQGFLFGHHVHPVRFFGNGKKNDSRLYICEACHLDIEELLVGKKPMEKIEYTKLHAMWLRGFEPTVV